MAPGWHTLSTQVLNLHACPFAAQSCCTPIDKPLPSHTITLSPLQFLALGTQTKGLQTPETQA